MSFGIIREDKLYGVDNARHADGFFVKVLAHGKLKERHVDHPVVFGIADTIDKVAYRLWRVAAAAQSAKRGHARVVPSRNQLLLYELKQLALAHHGVGHVQAVELVLVRTVIIGGQLVDKPIVKRAVYHKFQGADGMGHAFEIVGLPVRKIIHGVGFPGSPRTVVRDMEDPV
ncbi:hypothetical protein SDC9_148270 [bioreactor metagenome]|uniref:Uncharacterized protein n=1 Tax=bioreactor metagenome TaxID=1076179 RepID=A0A645EIB9_9ZZZZ